MTFNLNTSIRENVKALKPYASARDEFVSDGADMIFLDANENPFENGVNRYPDPHQRNLKELLASGKGITTDQLLLGNGSDEVLDLVFRAFCEPHEDNVITLPPTYGMYKVLAGINAIENREVVLARNFQPNVEAILKAYDKNTKIIFICSPNNPTGNCFDPSYISTLLAEFQGLVVLDEAYIDFATVPSWVEKLDQYPNLIVTQTLSKAYGMAGIRLGLALASPEIIAVLAKIKPPYNVNELTQQKAIKRIVDRNAIRLEVSEIVQERHKLMDALKGISFVEHRYPSDANFVLVKVDDADKRYAQLLQQGVVVRNRSSQPLCEQTLRFTVGTPEENKILMAVLQSLG